jgi:hypothetical protein
MGCCGGKLTNVTSLGEGQIIPASFNLFRLPAEKSPMAIDRIRICHACPFQTWLTEAEYYRNKDTVLPVFQMSAGRKLFCSHGRFWVPGQAYLIDGRCPSDRWG